MGLIKKSNEIAIQRNVKMMVYGQAGMGKTTLALSAPKPLLLDFDNGVKRVNNSHLGEVGIVQITNWQEVVTLLTTEKADLAPFETIVVDTIGKMMDFIIAYRCGQKEKAWRAYERYLALRPDDWGVLNNYAYELAIEGLRLDEALEMSRRTIEAQPQNANNLDTYGWILHLLGRDAEALPYLERALRLDPDNTTLREHYKTLKK